jgi:hypothetical protein
MGRRHKKPSKAPRRAARAAKRGESGATDGLQLLPAAMTTATRKRIAPIRSTSWPRLQASGTAAGRPLQKTPRDGMSEPYIPCQAQAQEIRHNERLHDFKGSHQGQGARRRPGRKGHDTLPRGGGRHGDRGATYLT